MHLQDYQDHVDRAIIECFGGETATSMRDRRNRALEEAHEVAQAAGMSRDEAHQLVDYTWSRPVGDLRQEVGGAMLTLAALCNAADIDMLQAAADELARFLNNIPQIRAKQATKPQLSPLPGGAETAAPPPSDVDILRKIAVGLEGSWAACTVALTAARDEILRLQSAARRGAADFEIAGIQLAFAALRDLQREAWLRALNYIAQRLGEDDRGLYVKSRDRIAEENPPPVAWVIAGNLDERFASPDEAMGDIERGPHQVIEVNEVAIVGQRFGVEVLIGNDDGDIDGHEISWFSTRQAAERFADYMQNLTPEAELLPGGAEAAATAQESAGAVASRPKLATEMTDAEYQAALAVMLSRRE